MTQDGILWPVNRVVGLGYSQMGRFAMNLDINEHNQIRLKEVFNPMPQVAQEGIK